MANVVDSVWVKTGENGKTEIFFKVISDNVVVRGSNKNLTNFINDEIISKITGNITEINNIKTSLGELLNTDTSVSQTINEIKSEIDIINAKDFANSIAPARFEYDSTLKALKLKFDGETS